MKTVQTSSGWESFKNTKEGISLVVFKIQENKTYGQTWFGLIPNLFLKAILKFERLLYPNSIYNSDGLQIPSSKSLFAF